MFSGETRCFKFSPTGIFFTAQSRQFGFQLFYLFSDG
jgi:hypothetical protein